MKSERDDEEGVLFYNKEIYLHRKSMVPSMRWLRNDGGDDLVNGRRNPWR